MRSTAHDDDAAYLARFTCRFGYQHATPSLAAHCTVHDPLTHSASHSLT